MKIPMLRPYNSAELENAVIDVVRSGRHVGGPEVESFEEEFASYIGVDYAVTANSATSAEMLALVALGVRPRSQILVPSYTMYATVEQIFQVGATPVFVDIDETFNMDPVDLESKITDMCVGILPVHFAGHSANMLRINEIAECNDLWVLEDCAQAHGAKCCGKRVGGFGIAGTFSFFPSKNLGTIGDGGVVTTNDACIAKRVRMLRDHGRSDRYTHEEAGFGLRFDPIKAAVCRLKLKLLDGFNNQRRGNAERYNQLLSGLGIVLPIEREDYYHVYHLYPILLPGGKKARNGLKAHLHDAGVEANIHYPVACHQQPATINLVGRCGCLPGTESVADSILSLPMYPGLLETEIEYICNAIKSFLLGR